MKTMPQNGVTPRFGKNRFLCSWKRWLGLMKIMPENGVTAHFENNRFFYQFFIWSEYYAPLILSLCNHTWWTWKVSTPSWCEYVPYRQYNAISFFHWPSHLLHIYLRVVANFDDSYLSSRKILFESVKGSWLPITRAKTYGHLKNLTFDPLSPLKKLQTWTGITKLVYYK